MSGAETGGRLGGVLQLDQNLELCMETFSQLQLHNLLTQLRTSENKVIVTEVFTFRSESLLKSSHSEARWKSCTHQSSRCFDQNIKHL